MRRGDLTAADGVEVHAATFLRQRLVILDRELLKSSSELRRIWLHELFHFVWWRLANAKRLSWERLLLRERGRGELGWSAEWRKQRLTASDQSGRSRKWREYCSESFCDTGAWIASGGPDHPERTLGQRWQDLRARWWKESIRYNQEGRTDS